MEEFQKRCNEILDNGTLFEEDQVDMLEELVLKKYGNLPAPKVEKIILDIMWKHKDPSKALTHKAEIIKVENVQIKVDIPSFERRLELQKQFLELDAMNEEARQKKFQRTPTQQSKLEQEYSQLLKKTEELRKQLYGDNITQSSITDVPPIDQIYNMFDKTVTKDRIQQALKSCGYNLVDAATLIMAKLKNGSTFEFPTDQTIEPKDVDQANTTITNSTLLHSNKNVTDKKYKVVCSFLIKTGQCLRADCIFNHDLSTVTCSYWLKGNCFNGDNCQFKHGLDNISSSTLEPNTTPNPTSNPTPNPALTSTPNSMPIQSSDLAISVPSSTSSIKKFNANSAISFIPSNPNIVITKPLRKPKFTPWDNPTESPYFKTYLNYKTGALKFEIQRKKYAQMSTEAWKSNKSGEAKKLSDKANKFEEKYFDSLKLADDDLFSYSETQENELWFEMYGLEFNDATSQLQSSITDTKSKYLRGSKTIYLVVPIISDTQSYKKTTKPILFWLESELYRYQYYNMGSNQLGSIIAIDPWSI
ncbi:hypothetical protein WICMUC_003250 [Wickerhamomyces mucosus]|uniref:C3H1-type domain-containing protein n=1 Tax=Wickerhamomyces mucosus TaxID=1378264 RepID=A0A9P8PLD3_9ASCO|nr:hypothetical protein WICMUC_003250 [Wickerhamomyces mucosus]